MDKGFFHTGFFHTGWRPLAGWIGVAALLWHFILFDLFLLLAALLTGGAAPTSPTGTEELVTILLALLGLGGLRTVEKIKGVSRDGPEASIKTGNKTDQNKERKQP